MLPDPADRLIHAAHAVLAVRSARLHAPDESREDATISFHAPAESERFFHAVLEEVRERLARARRDLELNGIENAVPLRFAVGAEHAVIEMDPTQHLDGRTRFGAGGDRAELRTLDSFGFRDVSLLEIDVEGLELLVLEGAAETIGAWRPASVIEIAGANRYEKLSATEKAHVDDVRRFLRERGYSLEFVTHSGEPHFLALPEPRP